MTFAAPGWIMAGLVAAAAAVAIHLLSWRMPTVSLLPTARFVPDEPPRVAARTIRIADILLLALRATLLLLIGIALARPTFSANRSGTARVILVERVSADRVAEVAEIVRSQAAGAPASVIVFDTAATLYTDPSDAIAVLGATPLTRLSLSAGLVGGIREAHRLLETHETVGISIVSSFARDAFDAATSQIRTTWPDSVRTLRIATVPGAAIADVEVRGPGDDDPIAAAVHLATAHRRLKGTVRIIRQAAAADDRAWAEEGGTLLLWPSANAGDGGVEGIHASGETAIGHMIRLSPGDSGRVVARWIDGQPAARETLTGSGCIRSIGFDVPDRGDFVLSSSFQRVLAVLAAPCGVQRSDAGVSDAELSAFAARPVGERLNVSPPTGSNRLAASLLALALFGVLGESLLRRQRPPRLARAVE